MGRSIGLNSSNLSLSTVSLTAGENIAAGDAVQLGNDNQAYKITCTDTAAVANAGDLTSAAQGQILAQTTLSASNWASNTNNMTKRPGMVQDSSGFWYSMEPTSASTYYLTKRTSSGKRIAAVGPFSATLTMSNIVLLTNGNLLVYGTFGLSIYTSSLVLVATPSISGGSGAQYNCCALTGGGFAFVSQGSTPANCVMAICDSTGTQVGSTTVVGASACGAGASSTICTQLSSGDIAWATGHGYYGIVTTSLTTTKAQTSGISAGGDGVEGCILSLTGGGFAVAANGSVAVYNNSGTQQGSSYVGTSGAAWYQQKLMTDGTNYIYVWTDNSTTFRMVGVTSAGVATAATLSSGTGFTAGIRFDAFYDRGLLVVAINYNSGGFVQPKLFVVNWATKGLVTSAFSFGIAAGTISGLVMSLIPLGDWSFGAMYDNDTTAGSFAFVGKYANTAVIGRAGTTTTAGSLVSIYTGAGTYSINAIKGTNGKGFDHSFSASTPTNLTANKGTLMQNYIILKGY